MDTNRMKILLKIVDNDFPKICNPEILEDTQSLAKLIKRDSYPHSGDNVFLRKTTSFDPLILQIAHKKED
jgi:hypothetical protein